MIKTIVYENYNLLGNSRLAYISTADAQHVIGCLRSQYQTIHSPYEQFWLHLFPDPQTEFAFCLVLRQALDLSQPKFTNKEITESVFIVIPGVVEINNVT